MRFFGVAILSFMVLEIVSIVLMADWIGGGPTLLLMLAGFIGGVMMLRRIGLAGVSVMNAALRQGKNISLYQLLWPIRYGVAAFLLMSPGFVSDMLTLMLLFPYKRETPATNRDSFQRDTERHYSARQTEDDDIIEGDYTVQSGADADLRSPKTLPPESK